MCDVWRVHVELYILLRVWQRTQHAGGPGTATNGCECVPRSLLDTFPAEIWDIRQQSTPTSPHNTLRPGPSLHLNSPRHALPVEQPLAAAGCRSHARHCSGHATHQLNAARQGSIWSCMTHIGYVQYSGKATVNVLWMKTGPG